MTKNVVLIVVGVCLFNSCITQKKIKIKSGEKKSPRMAGAGFSSVGIVGEPGLKLDTRKVLLEKRPAQVISWAERFQFHGLSDRAERLCGIRLIDGSCNQLLFPDPVVQHELREAAADERG